MPVISAVAAVIQLIAWAAPVFDVLVIAGPSRTTRG
jgi:hypothetical protein